MSLDHLKTPLATSLPRAIMSRIADANQLAGKSLPASVVSMVSSGIALVKFEVNTPFTLPQITVPVAMSEFVRLPLQPGCKGVLLSADARLGGITGLGGGTASLSPPANLSALVFVPLGDTQWSAVDGRVLVLYGPDGVDVRDLASGSVVSVRNGSAKLQHGANSVTVDSSGVAIVGTLTINGKPYLAHEHSGVTTGGGLSGGVVNP